jgi:hypothetical protein
MPYSSKKQEQFYQPHRIVVCQLDPGRYRGYAVYRIDTTKRYPEEEFIVATWKGKSWRNTEGYWEEGYNHSARYDSKQRAQDVAKEQATLLSLPYSIQEDYHESYRKLTGIQETQCVICGKGIGHRATPDVCNNCRLYVERGRLLDSEQGIYSVESKGLCSGHAGYDFSLPLAQAFYKVVGDFPEGKTPGRFGKSMHDLDHARKDTPVSGFVARGGASGRGTRVSMTAVQAEALQDIVDIIEQIDQTAYEVGKRKGSSILQSLAAGELPPDAFEKSRFEER